MQPVDIAIPTFDYQKHVSIDRGFGLIRRWLATDAAACEGARLRVGLLDKTNTASAVSADTAYRSAKNEAFLRDNRLREPHSPQETDGQADARADPQGQRGQIRNPLLCRTRLCCAEGSHGLVRPNRWHRSGDNNVRHCKHRLQHQTDDHSAQG
jgi:hypothetical protein